MYCPRCGEPAPTGSRRCAACGLPFTRSAARFGERPPAARFGRRQQPPANVYSPYDRDDYQPRPAAAYARGSEEPRRRSSHKAIGCLFGLILLAVVLVAGVALLSRGVVKPYVGRQIDQHLNLPEVANKLIGVATPSATATASDTEPVNSTAVVPTPPPGAHQVVITQDQLNQEIASHKDRIKPLDSASVTMTPGEMQVSMRAYGLSGTYRGEVAVANGRAKLTNGHIDGPLGWIVPIDPVQSALNDQLQDALNQNGLTVDSVTLQQGQMVVAVSPG